MNNPPNLEFCSDQDSNTHLNDIINYFTVDGNNLSSDKLNLISEGLGFKYTPDTGIGDFNQNNFYTFWSNSDKDELEVLIGGAITIIPTNPNYTNNYDVIKLSRNYNKSILQTFFCNQNTTTGKYPVVGQFDQDYYSQLENIYSYLHSDTFLGGNGLQGVSGQYGTIIPLMHDFCQAIIPPDATSDQSLYISGNQKIYKWCGCYVNPSGFAHQYGGELTNVCNPLCTNENTIKRWKIPDPNSTIIVKPEQESCNQTVCVIDQITIRSIDSQGNINFNQICPGCNSENPCTCAIDNSVQGILDKIITNENGTQSRESFKQVCPNANCYVTNNKGGYTKLKCNTNNAANTNKDPVLGYSGNGFLRNISDEENFTTTNYIVVYSYFNDFYTF